MSGQQQIVGAGGAALVGLAFWTGPGRSKVTAGLLHSHASDADQAAAHTELVKLAGAVLFVAILTVLAGVSRTWGSAMAAAVLGLLVLWTINHYGKK